MEHRSARLLCGVLIMFGLYLTSRYGYLLFHSLVEMFAVVVACSIFVIVWNARRLIDSSHFLLIGIAYLFVGGLDLLHTLAYKGMGVFPEYDTNLPTQLWIAARYTESLSLFIALLLLGRKLKAYSLLLCYVVVIAVLLGTIFYWNIFPVCFIEGLGLTLFKKTSEYIISLIFLTSIVLLWQKHKKFDRTVLQLLIAALVVSVGAELSFTLYQDPYGIFNLVGHFFKFISRYLIYKAMLSGPYVATRIPRPE